VLSGLNPKNLVFTLAAALAIAGAELPRGNELIALVVYVLVASIGVGMPVLWHAVARENATRTLTEWKGLLTANYATIMAVVFLVFGVKLLGQGLGDLIG
jgi:threonine/homoserine/homoserine lactone efflux protein